MQQVVFEIPFNSLIMEPDVAYIHESYRYLNWLSYSEALYDIRYAASDQPLNTYDSILNLINDRKANRLGSLPGENAIAVGSIEFTEKYLGKHIRPINVPRELMNETYTKRFIDIQDAHSKKIDEYFEKFGQLFIKSNTKCKTNITEIYTLEQFRKLQSNINDNLFISEVVSIEAEWRVFCVLNRILGCQQYIGDFRLKPSMEHVGRMISVWEDKPKAYTLDIALTDKGDTIIIEAHNFLSCGLYGFESMKDLAKMTNMAFKYEQNKQS